MVAATLRADGLGEVTVPRADDTPPRIVPVGWEGAVPSLSISHCAGWVGIALAPPGQRIGLDLEPAASVWHAVALRAMSAADAAALQALAPTRQAQAATTFWTTAEALAKGNGRGLPLMLARAVETGLQPAGRWDGLDFALLLAPAGLVCAIALDASDQPFAPPPLRERRGVQGL